MPKDTELDRLKTEEQQAFDYKQAAFKYYAYIRDQANNAHDAMQRAWGERAHARDVMNREFEARKAAFERHDAIWNEYGRIRDRNNTTIDDLRAEADSEHEAMKECFERASDAYEYGDKAEAPYYASEGHDHKDRRNELNAEVKRLIQEVRDAREYAESHAPRVSSDAFNTAKAEFEQAKAMHESAREEFKRLNAERDAAKQNFDAWQAEHARRKDAFQVRLAQVKQTRTVERENSLRNGTYRGTFMGMPAVVKVSDAGNSDQIQIFYGGKGRPDGEGHSHVNVVKDELRYWRESGQVVFERDVTNNL